MPHLSLSQRRQIERMHRQRLRQCVMARKLGVHPSTVKRELDRNTVDGMYLADQAQRKAINRKQVAGRQNQKKRAFRFLSKQSLMEWRLNFCITFMDRQPDDPVLGLPWEKYRGSRYRHWTYRKQKRAKRGKRFIRQAYLAWKRWYDRRRMRDHRQEALRRTPPDWWQLFLWRRPYKKGGFNRLEKDYWAMLRHLKRLQRREEFLKKCEAPDASQTVTLSPDTKCFVINEFPPCFKACLHIPATSRCPKKELGAYSILDPPRGIAFFVRSGDFFYDSLPLYYFSQFFPALTYQDFLFQKFMLLKNCIYLRGDGQGRYCLCLIA